MHTFYMYSDRPTCPFVDTTMNNEINYAANPLHGLSLESLLNDIVDCYGFDILFAYLNINCFKTNPSIESSIKFLKKTDWAREKVEAFYMYEYKNLPRASSEQFSLPPRDRIVPDGQLPGEPAELNMDDAERLREKRAKKAAEHGHHSSYRSNSDRSSNSGSGRNSERYSDNQRSNYSRENSDARDESPKPAAPSDAATSTSKGTVDPWAKARKKSER